MSVNNTTSLIGNLATDLSHITEIGSGESATKKLWAVLAVNGYVKQDGTKHTDFIPVTFWGSKNVDNLVKYLHKGSRLAVQGHIDTSTYVKDGKQVTDWSVRVDPFGTLFLDSKPAGGDGAAREQTLAELMQSGADLGEGVSVGADDIPF